MKTNTFYNPKNQYNQLLASEPYVDNEIAILRKNSTGEVERLDTRIDAETSDRKTGDLELDNKINTFNTIKVKWVNANGDKFTNIDAYFTSLMDPASDSFKDIEELKVELGQTIYIIEGSDYSPESEPTYEEWVCQYPDLSVTKNGLPKMIRLGAVDSILARINAPGSVTLEHNLYHQINWEQYYDKDFEGNTDLHTPVRGKAVAPCALRDFIDADKGLQSKIDTEVKKLHSKIDTEVSARDNADTSIRIDVNAALVKLTSDYNEADDAIRKRLDGHDARLEHIEAEIDGSTVENEIGFQGSRLDRIEAAIGINHYCCSNCGCEYEHCTCKNNSCNCSDTDNKCTIYCRLNEVESDLEEHYSSLSILNEQIFNESDAGDEPTLLENVKTNIENISNHENRLTTLEGIVNGVKNEFGNIEIEGHEQRIEGHEQRIKAEEENRKAEDEDIRGLITKVDGQITKVDDRITEVHEQINTDIAAINREIGKKENPATGTLWDEIKKRSLENEKLSADIGKITDTNSESIWAHINKNTALISNVKTIVGASDSSDASTVWGNINSNISAISDIQLSLGSEVEDTENNTAWSRIKKIEKNTGTKDDTETDSTLWGDVNALSKFVNSVNASLGTTTDDKSSDTAWGHIKLNADNISDIGEQLRETKVEIGKVSDSAANGGEQNSIWGNIKDNIKSIEGLKTEIGDKNDESSTITVWSNINNNKESIENLKVEIGNKDEDGGALTTTIWGNIKNNKESIEVLSDNIADSKIGKDSDIGPSATTLWGNINNIKTEIGNKNEDGEPSSTTIWGNINNNKESIEVLKAEIGDKNDKSSSTTIWGNINNNRELIEAAVLEAKAYTDSIIGENDSDDTNTVWNSINILRDDIKGINMNITGVSEAIDDTRSKIGENNSIDTNTVWGSINSLTDEIGRDSDIGPSTTTLWGNINNNKESITDLKNELSFINGSITMAINTTLKDGEATLEYSKIFNHLTPAKDSTNWYIFVNSVYLTDEQTIIYPEITLMNTSLANGDFDDRSITIKFDNSAEQTKITAVLSLIEYGKNIPTIDL